MKSIVLGLTLVTLTITSFSQNCIDCSLIDPNAICILIFDPVCGCDGVTYSNSCVAETQGGIVDYTSGECPTNPVNSCVNLAGLDFGSCLTILGYGMVDGDCTAISGCNTTTVGGVDYSIAFYVTQDGCEANCFCPVGPVDSDNDAFDNTVDCNDYNPDVYPGAPELCDNLDNDCDNDIDEDLPLFTYYFDNDIDGFGDELNVLEDCSSVPPGGYVTDNTDCNDGANTVYPGAPELCDNLDNDCDGAIDEDLTTYVYYTDSDSDGYGSPADSIITCQGEPPTGFVAGNTDCDDSDENIYPGAVEIMNNGIDEDCDGFDLIGQSVQDLEQVGIYLYPIPASDYLMIDNAHNQQGLQFRMIDLKGKLVQEQELMNNVNKIDLTGISNGNYFVELKNKDFNLTTRIVVIR